MPGMAGIAIDVPDVRTAPKRLLVPATIFLGAALLFAVEPLIAKMILPWFGGSAEVWIVCLLFFQAALLAGYLYAHLLSTRVAGPWQWRVHLFLLAASLAFLPIVPAARWKPAGAEEPLPLILGVLASSVGLPFLLLAATGPLVQAWLSRSRDDGEGARHSVYRLYALSNLGSLLALLGYPVLAEPWLATRIQAWSWSSAYCAFVLLSSAVAWGYRNAMGGADPATEAGPRPGIGARTLWFLLAMAPSALLLTVTHHMLRNIAAIPLLWVVPLALYLSSFIVCFDNPRWYWRPLWYTLFAAAIGTMIYTVVGVFLAENYVLQLAFYASGLFIGCMVCHGELAALKPEPSRLTAYYLIIASGGAAGGLLIAVLAPIVFSDDYDLALVLPAVALLAILVAWRRVPQRLPVWLRWSGLVGVLCGWAFVTGHMALGALSDFSGNLLSVRNFYGPLRVTKKFATSGNGDLIQLRNGNVIHGREYLIPALHCEPISYYGRLSGIGIALEEMGNAGPLKIGVIGLGAGMIAGYGRQGDVFRFYEINPLVLKIAAGAFHYLSCPGEHSFAIGDARLTLEREKPQQFDLLVVDAFTSDAIPVHLLTKEAFALYWEHLKPDGVLAVHASNLYVDLVPIVAVAAHESGKAARVLVNLEDAGHDVDGSVWVLVTSRPKFFSRPGLASSMPIDTARATAWTDDFSDLWRALK